MVPALGDPRRLSSLSRRSSRKRVSSLATRSPVSPKPRPRRKRADQAPLIDFCNRREGRAHPGATRFPAASVFSTRAMAIEGRGRQRTGYPAGSRAPALPVASTRPSFGTWPRGLLDSKTGTLVGQELGKHSWRGCVRPTPQGPPSTCRANGEAVDRTRVPLLRSKPRLSPRPFAGSIGTERRRPFFAHTTSGL
jgi:hypothetical protein